MWLSRHPDIFQGIIAAFETNHMTYPKIVAMSRYMSAQSANIASLVFIKSAKYQKNSLKGIENLDLLHAENPSNLFLRLRLTNSCPQCLFSVFYAALAYGTLKLCEERKKWRIFNKLRVPSAQNSRGFPSNDKKRYSQHNVSSHCAMVLACFHIYEFNLREVYASLHFACLSSLVTFYQSNCRCIITFCK